MIRDESPVAEDWASLLTTEPETTESDREAREHTRVDPEAIGRELGVLKLGENIGSAEMKGEQNDERATVGEHQVSPDGVIICPNCREVGGLCMDRRVYYCPTCKADREECEGLCEVCDEDLDGEYRSAVQPEQYTCYRCSASFEEEEVDGRLMYSRM